MTGRVRVSRTGLDLIKSFEGFREHSVRLPDGRWIVGYGHVKTAREGITITEPDAEQLLRFDLKQIEEAIYSLVHAPLSQNQYDALVSLIFNISPGQFKESEILRRLNGGDYLGAASGFDAWRRARINGRYIVVDALVRRRAMERALFLEPAGARPTAPTPMVTPEFDPAMNGGDAKPEPRPAQTSTPPASTAAPSAPITVSPDVASAVRRIAEDLDAKDPSLPAAPERQKPASGSLVAEPRELNPQPQAPPAANEARSELSEASRLAAERLARILARTQAHGPGGATAGAQLSSAPRETQSVQPSPVAAPLQPVRTPAAAPVSPPRPASVGPATQAASVRAPARIVAPAIPEDMPDFSRPAAPSRSAASGAASRAAADPRTPASGTVVERVRSKPMIDDTEVVEPTTGPGAQAARVHARQQVGARKQIGASEEAGSVQPEVASPRSTAFLRLIPWMLIGASALLGIVLASYFYLTAGEPQQMSGATIALGVLAVLALISVYFLHSRWPRDEE
jgi:GH24 family phage-related lysozyme (muramidase)